MRTQTKNILMLILNLVLALSFSLFVGMNIDKNTVMADGGEPVETVIVSQKIYDGFELREGASIRIPNEQNNSYGIRFGTKIPADTLTEIQKDYVNYQSITFYTLIARQTKLLNGIASLTPENESAIKVRATKQPTIDGNTDYKVALLDIPETATDEILVARSYADVVAENGKTYRIYAKNNDNARSIKEVALSYLQGDAGENATKIEKEFFSVSSSASLIGASENDIAPASLEVDLTKTLQQGENALVAYYGTQKLTGSIKDGKLNLTNVAEEIGTLELGVEQEITVYTDKYNAYKGKVVNATKVIDEAEELEVFTITAPGTANAQNFIEGYYVVTKDIDATSWAGNNHNLTTTAFASQREGFKGTFNMAGHTISLNTSTYGLFGNVNKATFKNGKFIFTEKSGSTQSYGLAYEMGGDGTDKGYTSFTNVDFEVNGFGLGSEGGNSSEVLTYRHTGWLYLTNCNFTVNADINAANKNTGILIRHKIDWRSSLANPSIFINDCTITTNITAPIITTTSSGNIALSYWAGNDEGKTHDATNGSFVFSNGYKAHIGQCTGITRTITGELKAFDLTSSYMYSVDDGLFIKKGEGTTFTLDQLATELKIGACTVVSEGISYTNGVLSGIKVNAGATDSKKTTADADYWTDTSILANTRVLKTTKLELKSGGSKYYLEFYAYDKVINEAEDFAVLDFNQTTNEHVKTYSADQAWLHGFFALSNNIAYKANLAAVQHTSAIHTMNYKYGFRGVFDGNGYTAELNVDYEGVFGDVAGSVIKDTTFILHFPSSAGYGLARQGSGENYQSWTYYQNITVEVVGTLPNTNDTAALFKCISGTYCTLENVNVKAKTVDNTVKTTGLLVVWMYNLSATNSSGNSNGLTSKLNNVNVYTNSTLPIATKVKNEDSLDKNLIEVWASNENFEVVKNTTDTLVATKAYRKALPTEE